MSQDEPVNVVLIISDDQAWTDYGFMGHPHIETPHLDRLASESLTFTRGYVPSSLCRASLASIITGLFPHQHKITSNDPPRGLPKSEFAEQRQRMIRFMDDVPSLPRLLAERGYASFQAGKWWEGPCRCGGFTDGMTHGDPARGGRHGDAGLSIGRRGLQPVFDFIESSAAKKTPFFLWYAPFLPHTPHNPPRRLSDRYREAAPSVHIAKYWAMCTWFDETCGELLQFIDDRELRRNTLIVYVTDNGWIQNKDRRGYAPRSKRSPYDGGLRTPLMLRLPGRVEPRRDDATPVSSLDIAPTVLAACRGKAPQDLWGVDLLKDKSVSERPRIFGDVYLHNAVDITKPLSSLSFRWCIEGRWKLIVPHPPNAKGAAAELFDLVADPLERANLAEKETDRVRAMRRRIDAWLPVAR